MCLYYLKHTITWYYVGFNTTKVIWKIRRTIRRYMPGIQTRVFPVTGWTFYHFTNAGNWGNAVDRWSSSVSRRNVVDLKLNHTANNCVCMTQCHHLLKFLGSWKYPEILHTCYSMWSRRVTVQEWLATILGKLLIHYFISRNISKFDCIFKM